MKRINDMESTPISSKMYGLLRSIGSNEKVSKGVYLFHEGMDAENIFVVESGLFQVGKTSKEGKELTLRLCQQDAIMGELTMFSDDAVYFLNAKALETSSAYVVNKKELEEKVMEDKLLAFEFMKWSSDQMRIFQYKIRDLLLYGKKGALYSTLIRLTNSYGTAHPEGIKLNIALTDTELASFAAATRESANRILIDLRKKDIVSTLDTGEILIKDLEYLRNQIGCEECPLVICHID